MVLSSAVILSKSVCCFFSKKYFGNISRVSSSLEPDLSGLMLVQIVCKGYQQTTLESKEF